MTRKLHQLDILGQEVPRFNIKGQESVKTSCGAYTSTVVFILTLIFGLLKLQHLLERRNPQIVTRTVKADDDDSYSTADNDFMMAFAAVSEKNSTNMQVEGKSDERYLKWFLKRTTMQGGSVDTVVSQMHRCTDQEFYRFYSVDNENDAILVAKLHQQGHFYCVDWRDLPNELFGYWKSGSDFTNYDIMLMPCAINGDQECINDEQDVK